MRALPSSSLVRLVRFRAGPRWRGAGPLPGRRRDLCRGQRSPGGKVSKLTSVLLLGIPARLSARGTLLLWWRLMLRPRVRQRPSGSPRGFQQLKDIYASSEIDMLWPRNPDLEISIVTECINQEQFASTEKRASLVIAVIRGSMGKLG
eukprot:878895-Pyramimonas_sp.AAC.1